MKLTSLTSSPRRRQFFSLLVFYISFLWFRNFATAVLGPYFLTKNINLQQMILANGLFFLIGSLWLVIFKTYFSRLSWFGASVASIIGLLLAMRTENIYYYYLYAVFLGIGSILYFIPYNIAHFRLTPGHRNSFSAAIMFSVMPVISFAAPLLAGFLAQISYLYIWYGSFLFFLVVLALTKFQNNFQYKIKFKKDFVYLRPTWLLLVLEGLWEPVIFGVISVFTLNFIQTPLGFGSFLSYLGLVAIIANLFLGHVSDKLKNRVRFLIPVTVLLGLSTIAMPWAIGSLITWIIITGLINFFAPLFWNFSTAYFVDLQPDVVKTMPAREWVLTTARTIGFLIVYLNFYWQEKPTDSIYLLGGVMLLYPLVLLYNTRHGAKS